ncbi:hypothetical protein AVEN_214335-1 [Araneus ventricosus]|uniref:Uncharacterized protein n=1 Tax=Araneus ventricosus TaxID=182803 RepID=A0A4Y2HZP8_ARAVE|nr:hypothetical protein AVEN_214335-1 [Araneus ventricosus]
MVFVWNADTKLADYDAPVPDTLMSDGNSRRCIIAGRRGAKFTWTVPTVLRRYMDSATCFDAVNKKPVLSGYFEEITGQKDFRVPSSFRCTIRLYPTGLPNLVLYKPVQLQKNGIHL